MAANTEPQSAFTKVVASLVLLAAVAAGALLVMRADDPDTTDIVWTRWIYVFGALEAMAFAGAGWLFGREVNRKALDQAEEQAAEHRAKADAGVKLASAIRERAESTTERAVAPSTHVENLVVELLA